MLVKLMMAKVVQMIFDLPVGIQVSQIIFAAV